MTGLLDFDTLSAAQQRVAGHVAINQDLGHPPRVLSRLVDLGVIESYEESRGGRPELIVTRYRMPLGVHLAWCEWCSRQYAEEQ